LPKLPPFGTSDPFGVSAPRSSDREWFDYGLDVVLDGLERAMDAP